jgi:SAM-dependent methyltransferase
VTGHYATAAAWAAGPDRIYRALAAASVDLLPPVRGLLVLDAGAGTGAAGAALRLRGARVVAVDASAAMLAYGRPGRADLPARGDVTALPLRSGAVDAAVAAFVVNHLTEPAACLAELGRVVRPGGPVLATTFPAGAGAHPVKAAVDGALAAHGFRPPGWHADLRGLEGLTGEPERLAALAVAAGLAGPEVVRVELDLDPIGARALAAWRLGMAHTAPWVAGLDPPRRRALVADATAAVSAIAGPLPPLPSLTLLAVAGRQPRRWEAVARRVSA